VVEDPATGGLLSGGILDLLSVLHKAAAAVPARRLNANSCLLLGSGTTAPGIGVLRLQNTGL
jgi:hypothetical protein